jgi:hypothetical protein
VWPFGIFYDHLVYFMAIWYTLLSFGMFYPRFGMLHQGKSGNPAIETSEVPYPNPISESLQKSMLRVAR